MGIESLVSFSDTYYQDVYLILSDVLKVSPTYLYTHLEEKVTSSQIEEFHKKINRRKQGEPVAYILGRQGFWKFDLIVSPDVLIPRPETELLMEIILNHFTTDKQLSILDLGTGSGAIALALAYEFQKAAVLGIDNSQAALEIAKKNANKLNIKNIDFLCGDWYAPLPKNFKCDVIVSNPPYIAEGDPNLEKKVLAFEPVNALISAKKGMEAITQIVENAKNYLVSGGMLLLEHGFDQEEKVTSLMEQAGFYNIQTYKDLNHLPRATLGFLGF